MADLVSMAQGTAKDGPLTGQIHITKVLKDDWFQVYVEGTVTEQGSNTSIAGALVTATYLSDDGIGGIAYYDFSAIQQAFLPNFGTESHCTTEADGAIHLRIDVEANDAFWEASFNICVTRDGYQNQCLSVDFDFSDNDESRFFSLVPDVNTTPTSTPTLAPTLSATPTLTETPSGNPTAVHPELDVNHNGIIDAGDLLLLLADWMRPVN
jgi:hypothetical protein